MGLFDQEVWPLLSAMAILAGCVDAPASPAVEYSDSSGVMVASVGPLPGLYAQEFQWQLARVRSIPADRTPSEPPRFFKPEGVIRLDDGTIIVNDRGDLRILVIDSRQDSVTAAFARPGEGPGEIGGYAHLWAGPSGSVWVLDVNNQKIIRFGLDGQVLFERGLARAVGGTAIAKPRQAPPGLLASRWYPSSDPARALEDTLTYLDPEAGTFHSIAPLWRQPGPLINELMSPRVLFTPVGRGAVVGRSHENAFFIYTDQSLLQAEIRLPLTPRPISGTDVHAIVGEFAGVISPETRTEIGEPHVYTHYPITNELYSVDDSTFALLQGRWMSAAEDAPIEPGRWVWRLFSVNGTYRGTIHWPDGFQVLWVGNNHAVGIASDSLGAEYLEEWELSPPAVLAANVSR